MRWPTPSCRRIEPAITPAGERVMPQTDPSHPEIESFFHEDTGTWTHVVHDGEAAAVIDPVLDYDAAAARTATTSADAVLAFVQRRALRVEWILETHEIGRAHV